MVGRKGVRGWGGRECIVASNCGERKDKRKGGGRGRGKREEGGKGEI